MKILFLPVLTTIVGISFVSLVMAKPSLAQFNSVDTNTSIDTQGTKDPLSNLNSGNFNVLDLIHRANFGKVNWNPAQQNEQLDSAAAVFKTRQQELFKARRKPTPNPTLIIPKETILKPSVSLPSK